jgi:tRNA threonylcarbamoyl adenosine modification protein YeaZ
VSHDAGPRGSARAPVRVALALEASQRPGSVALAVGAQRAECELEAARAHASDLLPCAADLLARLGASPRELELVVVGSGPGSYTGLRVAMASALGLARASGARLLALPSCEAQAQDALAPGERALWLHDARGGQLAWAELERDEREVRLRAPPRLAPASELVARARAAALVLADAGSSAQLTALGCELAQARAWRAPSARALLEIALARWADGSASETSAPEPLYLR